MGGCPLDSTTIGGNERFNGGGVKPTSKLLLLGLDARDHRDRQELFVDATIKIQDLSNLGMRMG